MKQHILLLQHPQTFRAHTALVILADILHFVQAQLNRTALAFGEGVRLTFHGFAAAFAADDLVFGVEEVHSR